MNECHKTDTRIHSYEMHLFVKLFYLYLLLISCMTSGGKAETKIHVPECVTTHLYPIIRGGQILQ
jgi:hypothetical protein